MAKDLTAEDIARETYLFKYNMESGIIGTLLTLFIGVPLLILLQIILGQSSGTSLTSSRPHSEIPLNPEYDPLNPPYIE